MTKKKIKKRYVLLLLLLFFGTHYLLTNINKYPSKKADVIIVLGTSPNPNKEPNPILKFRIDKGIELYKKKYASKIIVTGTKVADYYESEVMKDYCIKKGIPISDIIEENNAKNTVENALYSAEIMKKNNYKSAIVVSSRTHIPRSKLLFNKYNYHFEFIPSNHNLKTYAFGLPVYLLEQLIIFKIKTETYMKSSGFQSRHYPKKHLWFLAQFFVVNCAFFSFHSIC